MFFTLNFCCVHPKILHKRDVKGRMREYVKEETGKRRGRKIQMERRTDREREKERKKANVSQLYILSYK